MGEGTHMGTVTHMGAGTHMGTGEARARTWACPYDPIILSR